MTPAKLLVAQRLIEAAAELRAIVDLMGEYKHDPQWNLIAGELANASETAEWWANEVRAER